MTIPYKIEDLDALMQACIGFTDDHEPYFMAGNIAGRSGVTSDIDAVRRMMEWVSQTDKELLEYSGIGHGNTPYFRIGYGARNLTAQGGFKRYFARRIRSEVLNRVLRWAPIAVSVLALVVSVLAWLAPQGSKRADEINRRIDEVSKRVDDVRTHVGSLEAVQNELRDKVATLPARPTPPSGSKKTPRNRQL